MEQILSAIHALYTPNQTPEVIKQANAFLMEEIKKQEAWNIIEPLFNTPSTDSLCCHKMIYASIVLERKVCFFYNEIPNVDNLFAFIMKLLIGLKGSNRAILSHLSFALCSLCIQSNAWERYFPEITRTFLSDQSNESKCILIQIFSFFAESKLKLKYVGEDTLERLNRQLSSQVDGIMKFLCSCYEIFPSEVLNALYSWIRFVHINIHIFQQYPILDIVFHSIQNSDYREDSFDLFSAILMKLYDLSDYEDSYDDIEFCIQLATNIIQRTLQIVCPLINKEVSTESSDSDDLANLIYFYCQLSNTLTTYIRNVDPSLFIQYYTFLVQCLNVQNRNVTQAIGNNITTLLEFLHDDAKDSDDDDDDIESVYDPQFSESVIQRMLPILTNYLDLLVKHSCYPDTTNVEEINEFRTFRKEEISDFLRQLVIVLPQPEEMFSRLLTLFTSNLQTNWKLSESALYSFRSLARVASSLYKFQSIATMLANIIQIKVDNQVFMSTAILTVGRYCDWIHAFAPNMSIPCLRYVIQFINEPSLIDASSIAFANIIDGCQEEVIQIFDEIAKVFMSIWGNILNNYVNNEDDYESIIVSFIQILSKQQVATQIEFYKNMINNLIECIKNNYNKNKSISTSCLQILTIIFKGMRKNRQRDLNSICQLIESMQLYGMLDTLVNYYVSIKEVEMIELIQDVFSETFKTIGYKIIQISDAINTLTIKYYQTTHLSCFISMFYSMITSMKTEPPNMQIIQKIILYCIPFMEGVFQFLTSKDINSDSESIKEIFTLIEYVYEQYPREFEDSILIERIVPWSLHFLSVSSNDAFKKITDCVTEMFVTNVSTKCRNYLVSDGETLIHQILMSVLKNNNKTRRSLASGLFVGIYYHYPELFVKKMAIILSQKTFAHVSDGMKQSILDQKLDNSTYKANLIDFFNYCGESLLIE